MSAAPQAAAPASDQVVASALREISHIASLPEITLKVVELVDDPKSTAQDLHKVIANDPALCTRILKVVNSSFYGLPGQIGSINRAIVMLGLSAVKNIAIAASLAKLFRGGDLTPALSAKKLWEHAVSVAVASKMLADKLKFGAGDEAFLAGLMHDIGVTVEMQFDRNKLVEAVNKAGADAAGVPARDLLAAEAEAFGATHEQFGKGLCERWKFPRTFALVCGHHHAPLTAPPEGRTLPSLVYAADRLVAACGGYRLDLISTDFDPGVCEVIKLGPEKITELTGLMPDQLKAVAGLLA